MIPTVVPDWNGSPAATLEGANGPFHGFARSLTAAHARLEFEDLLADLSASFVRVPAAQVDGQVQASLQRVVQFLDVDRSSLAECLDDGRQLRITHSHEKVGIPPMTRSVLNDQLPWYAARILRGEMLRFDRLPEDLPPEAIHEREYVARTGMKSHVMIPCNVAGSILGAIGVTSFGTYRAWPGGLVRRLRIVGEIFANALARKQADQALRQREQHHRELVATTRAVPWEADARTYQVRHVGPQIVRLLGYPLEDWYREGFWTARLHPDDRERVLGATAEAVRLGKERELEYRLISAAGREIWVHDSIAVPGAISDTPTIRGVMIDVTARKTAEDEALRLRDQLARVARVTLLGELAAAIAHEINQPLCAIVSNAQAAQRFLTGNVPDPAEVNATLRDIANDGQRASEVIGRIRTLLQKGQPARTRFDLNEAIRDVVALMRHQLARKGIDLSCDLAEDLPPVFGDRVQLQQVVLNLLVNAVDALGQAETGERKLSLRSARDERRTAVVSVRDSGPRVAAEHFEHIFDALFTTKPDGMGIGLTISRSIVEAHGGRIWADPDADGATFHFTLPLAEEATP